MTELETKIVEAAQEGNIELLRAIASEHGTRAIRAEDDPQELTTLHWAAAAGNEDMVRYLLSDEVGASPTALRGNNFSPLHAAAMHGHAGICRVLLERGASPNVQTDPQLYSPLHSAAWAGHLDAISVLLELGARTDLLNCHGEAPVDTAKRQEEYAAVTLLESARVTSTQV